MPEESRRGRQAERQRALSALDGAAAGGTTAEAEQHLARFRELRALTKNRSWFSSSGCDLRSILFDRLQPLKFGSALPELLRLLEPLIYSSQAGNEPRRFVHPVLPRGGIFEELRSSFPKPVP